jgi:hypothetical protein
MSVYTTNKTISQIILILAILDVLTDIYFLNAILNPPQEKEETDTDKHPLIGRRYIITDNSYAIDKESGVEVSGLNGKEYIIVSDPYVDEVESRWTGSKHKLMFVDVFSLRSARKYRVLFCENGIVED